MSRLDSFAGSMLIIVVICWTTSAVAIRLRDGANWLNLIFAACSAWSGLMIGRSVWRDRL